MKKILLCVMTLTFMIALTLTLTSCFKHKHDFSIQNTSIDAQKSPATCTQNAVYYYSCSCGEISTEAFFEAESATGHNYEASIQDADCTSLGYTVYTCTNCSDSYKDDYTTPHAHDWISADCTNPMTCANCGITAGYNDYHYYEIISVLPTCTSRGYVTHTCIYCGNTYTDNHRNPLGHVWLDADCNNPKRCAVCEITEGEKNEHSYDAFEQSPTCTEDGYTKYTCKCGDTYTEAGNPASGHEWIDATCENPKTCNTCGETEGEVNEHNYYVMEVIEPTCTDGGYTIKCCWSCDSYYISNKTEAIGHDYAPADCYTPKTCKNCGMWDGGVRSHDLKLEVVDPTCEYGGYTVEKCQYENCDYSIKYGYTQKLGHDWVNATCTTYDYCQRCNRSTGTLAPHNYKVTVIAPTCTAEGYTLHKCEDCGYDYCDAHTCPTGHSWTDATCTAPKTCSKCQKTEGPLGHEYVIEKIDATCEISGTYIMYCRNCEEPTRIIDWIDKKGHQYDEKDGIVTEPTCTEDGYITHTCTVCNKEIIENGEEKLEHRLENVVALAPTCTEPGYTNHLECAFCDYTTFYIEIAPTGHKYEAEVTAPTCTEKGYTTYTCNVCGDTYVGNYTDALGHSYNAVVTAPTCTTKGYTTYTCSVCDDTYVGNYTDALGHEGEKLEEIQPTCSSQGYTLYECTSCSLYYISDHKDQLTHNWISHEYGCVPETCEHCGLTRGEAPGHDYAEKYTFAPTCTTYGYTYYICTVCGDGAIDNYKPASGHNWCEPTCDYDGYCTDCFAQGEPAKGHDKVEATCEEDGYCINGCYYFEQSMGHSYVDGKCANCGYCENHTLTIDEKFATCEAAGYHKEKCSNCKYEISVIDPPMDHQWSNYYDCQDAYCYNCGVQREATADHDRVDPTCENEGYCSICGQPLEEATGHRDSDGDGICDNCGLCVAAHIWATVMQKPATCTDSGFILRECTVCNYREEEFIVASYHNGYNDDDNDEKCDICGMCFIHKNLTYDFKEPTCTEWGYTRTYCSDCQYYNEDLSPFIGHEWNDTCYCNNYNCYETRHELVTKVIKPTCTEYGYKITVCNKCGALENETTYDPIGHSLDGETCKNCQQKVHFFVIKEITYPTCTKNGSYTLGCNNCNYTFTEILETYGHDYKDDICTVCGILYHRCYFVEQKPTCFDDGYIDVDCKTCGYKDRYVIEAKHHYVNGKCKDCQSDEHIFKAIEIKYPTCEEFGYITYECVDCGEKKTENYEFYTHSYADGECEICGLVYHEYNSCEHEWEGIDQDWENLECGNYLTCAVCGFPITIKTHNFEVIDECYTCSECGKTAHTITDNT